MAEMTLSFPHYIEKGSLAFRSHIFGYITILHEILAHYLIFYQPMVASMAVN